MAALLLAATATAVSAQTAPADSVARAVGTVFGTYLKSSLSNLENMGVNVDRKAFLDAVADVLDGQPTGFTPATADEYMAAYIAARRPMAGVDTLSVASQKAFVDSIAATPGAVTTPTGLVFIVLREGEGPMPDASDSVVVDYLGRFFDGLEFDRTSEGPVTFRVADLTPGFSEGLRMMRPGGQYRLVMPASLGYGSQGIPGVIPGNAALDFIVNLQEIKPKE